MTETRELPHETTLPADVVAILARAERTRDLAHDAAERAFAECVALALKAAGLPEGAPFEIEAGPAGGAVVRYGDAPPAPALVTDAEGAE